MNFFTWCSSVLSNGKTGDPSTKRVAFLLYVVGALSWLTFHVVKHGITSEWNVAFGIFTGSVTTAYVGGKAIERKAAKDEVEGANATARITQGNLEIPKET